MKLFTLLLTSFLLLTSNVDAKTTNLDLSESNAIFGNVVAKNTKFDDYYYFNILEVSDLSSNIAVSFSNPAKAFSKFTVSLYDNTDFLLGEYTPTQSDSAINNTIFLSTLPVADNYYIHVSGKSSVFFNGAYSGTIDIISSTQQIDVPDVPSVPEPESWAMMLLGLSVIKLAKPSRKFC